MKNKLYFLKVVFLFMLGISQCIHAEMIKLKKSEYITPARLGNFEVYHEDNTFYVGKDKQLYEIAQYNIDKDIRNIPTTKLLDFLGRNKPQYQIISFEDFQALKSMNKYVFIEINDEEKEALFIRLNDLHKNSGYLAINQSNSGQYSIRAMVRLKGGGPISSTIAYWATKTIIYAVALAGTGATVVATGGLAGAGAGAMIAGGTAISTAEATMGMVIIAGGVVGAGMATEAAIATGTTIVSCGGISSTIAAIEGAANGMAILFLWLPFP